MRVALKTCVLLFSAGVVVVILVAGWPTLYRYDKVSVGGADNQLVRTNRLTGTTELLTINGWGSLRPSTGTGWPGTPDTPDASSKK